MNPDDLLAQIRDLLGQYLALGPDTPVAAEAQALSQAIDQTGGGQGPGGGQGDMGAAGMPPPDMGAMGGMPPMGPPDDGGSPPPEDSGDNGDPFKKARKGAKAFLKSKA
jgi:hypothetical protein